MEKWQKYLFWCTVLASVLVKLLLVPDIRINEPHHIADTLIETGEFKYWFNGEFNYNYQFPVYPFLVACTYLIANSPISAIILNLLLSVLSAIVLFRLANLLFKQAFWPSFIVVIGLLAHPVVSFYQIGMVHPFSLDVLCSLTLIYFPFRWQHFNSKRAAIYGIIMGIALLNRPTLIVFAFPALMVLYRTPTFRVKLTSALILIALSALPMGIWLVRNHQIYGEWSLNSSYGQNLWIGIQPETEGTAQLPNGLSYYHLMDSTTLAKLPGLNPVKESQYFADKYQGELDKTPGLFWSMYGKKLKNFWGFRSDLAVDYPNINQTHLTLYKIGYLILLVFAAIGVILTPRQWKSIFVAMILLSLFQAWFYVETRHRILIEPLMILFSVGGVYMGLKRIRKIRKT